MSISVVIVDDEPMARSRLERYLSLQDNVQIIAQASHGEEAVALSNELKPDVLLMDIQMPGMNGLEAAKLIIEQQKKPPAIIFCTAYDEYALQAFEAHAVDYLLKPVSIDALNQALHKARRLSRLQIQQVLEASGPSEKITIQQDGFLSKLPVDDILYFRAEEKQVIAGKRDGEVIIDYTMKVLEGKLLNEFVRVHRNALVNRQSIISLFQDESGQSSVKLKKSDRVFLVSRRHLSDVKGLFKSEL